MSGVTDIMSNNTLDLLESVTFPDRYHNVVGIVYMITSVLIIPIQLGISFILLYYRDYRAQTAYQIMFSIGVADLMQLATHLYSGIVTITRSSPVALEGFMGGMANAAWIAVMPQLLVLAVNRFLVFKSINRQTTRHVFKVLIVLCWLYGFLFFISYCTPFTGMVFDFDAFCWSYDGGSWSEIVGLIEYYTTVPFLAITFVVYVAIVILIVSLKTSFTTSRVKLGKNEFRLLVQSIIIFAYAGFLICCWHYYALFLPDSPWTVVTINYFWILFSAVNPMLYLVMNRQMRERFFALRKLRLEASYMSHLGTVSGVTPSKQGLPRL